jgi:hypothetical protein
VRLLCQLSNLNIVVQTKIVWFFCGFAPLKGYTASAVTMAFYGVSVAIPLFSPGVMLSGNILINFLTFLCMHAWQL